MVRPRLFHSRQLTLRCFTSSVHSFAKSLEMPLWYPLGVEHHVPNVLNEGYNGGQCLLWLGCYCTQMQAEILKVRAFRAGIGKPQVPQVPLSCMFQMFPCSNTPDSNEWVVIKLCGSQVMTVHLNQVCWSRETSRTCRTVSPEGTGLPTSALEEAFSMTLCPGIAGHSYIRVNFRLKCLGQV